MSLRGSIKGLMYLMPFVVGALTASNVRAQSCAGGSCGATAPACCGGCDHKHCPGPYIHCTPKVPCLKYKCSCGKPLCDICDMPGYGYYPTCWRAWDQPLNYVCAVPTPTQLVQPPVEVVVPLETLPAPQLSAPRLETLPPQR